ncbi:hypothetical protein QP938_13295 [Porticoccaceae bacterium LTM1]|nr:hypothetical protein QP938_13295 [Porticoccaceae bacterium LTM1]
MSSKNKYRVALYSTLLLITVTAAVPYPVPAEAAKHASAKQCLSWQKQLDKINKKLRKGYKVKEGRRLRERRDELETKIRKLCN